jgi:hypothetical protein
MDTSERFMDLGTRYLKKFGPGKTLFLGENFNRKTCTFFRMIRNFCPPFEEDIGHMLHGCEVVGPSHGAPTSGGRTLDTICQKASADLERD